MNINFKKFKKIAYDKASTTLKHDDGHLIQVAHAKLTPKVVDQLKALPTYDDGGAVEADTTGSSGSSGTPPEPNKKAAEAVQKGAGGSTGKGAFGSTTPAQGWANIKAAVGLAKGGPVRQSNPKLEQSKLQPPKANYAEGDEVDVSDVGAAPPQSMMNQAAPQDQTTDPGPTNAGAYVQQPYQQPYNPMAEDAAESPSNGKEINPSSANRAPAQSDESEETSPNGTPPIDPNSPNFQRGYQQQMGGIAAQAKAAEELGQKQAAAQQQQIDNTKTILDAHQANMKTLETERQAHMQDIKDGFIDPNKYWVDHSRLAAGLGIILAGFNPTDRPNAALQMINNEIDRSIDAQKANLGVKQNLLSATMSQFKNVQDAETMTRVLMSDSLNNKLAMSAAQSVGPMAKAQAQQLQGQLQQQAGMAMMKLGAGQTARQMANSGDESLFVNALNKAQPFAPEVYKDLQSKYLPGIGVANVPVPPADREAMTGFNIFKQRIGDAIAFQDQMGKTGAWSPDTMKEANNLKLSLTGEMNKLSGLKRLNAVEYENYKKQVGNIGGINAGGTIAGLKDIGRQLDQHMDAMAGSLGVRPFNKTASQQQSAPQIKTVNGVKYMRGPNGQAVKVQ